MRIAVTGAGGMLGSSIMRLVPDAVAVPREIDHFDDERLQEFFLDGRIDTVIHCAARVGGLAANIRSPIEFFEDNVRLNTAIVRASAAVEIKKFVGILSTCVYPREEFVKYPLTEDQLHVGPPHDSNFGYAYAKRMLEVECRSYRQQRGANFITVIPNNMYGPYDNFSREDSHVVPALMLRFFEAQLHGHDTVSVWGSGRQEREFTYVDDVSKAIMWLVEHYDGGSPVNVGNTTQVKLSDLVSVIADVVGFKGTVQYQSDMPEGQLRKPSSIELLRSLGYSGEFVSLRAGVVSTLEYLKRHYPIIRGFTQQ